MKLFGAVSLFLVSGANGASEPTRILMVLTSNDELDGHAHQTGWYLPEAAHPYAVFREAGVEMTWASPKGGEAPLDASSIDAYKKDPLCVDFHTKAAQAKLWKETTPLKDIRAQDFDAVFVVGGYGVMGDLVANQDFAKIAASIHEDGGVVSGVCHGPAALVDVKLSDGTFLVKGKEVACFTDAEEAYMKENAFDGKDVLPKDTCEEALKHAGAKFTKDEIWTDHVAVAGKLVTGQNPQSAKSTAEAVLKALGVEEEQEEIPEKSAAIDDEFVEDFVETEDDDAGEMEDKFELVSTLLQKGKPSTAAPLLLGTGGMVFAVALVHVIRQRLPTREAELETVLKESTTFDEDLVLDAGPLE